MTARKVGTLALEYLYGNHKPDGGCYTHTEACSDLRALMAENARLRAALDAIAAHHTCPDGIRSLALAAVEERSGAAASTAGEGVKP